MKNLMLLALALAALSAGCGKSGCCPEEGKKACCPPNCDKPCCAKK